MPASRRLYVNRTFDATGWTGGDYGFLPPWEAPRNSFTGTNVMRYVGGALGPRYGLKKIAGASIGATIHGMGYNPYAKGGTDIWIVSGTTVYLLNSTTGGALITATGSLAATPVHQVYGVPLGPNNTAKTYIGNDTDKMYVIDHVAQTVSAVSGSPSTCAQVAQYGEFTLAVGAGSNINKLNYSLASDPTTWPAQNFINVGMGSRITGMWVQRGALIIATSDGGWWNFKGTLGGNGVLKRIGDDVSPLYQENAATLANGNIAYTFGSAQTGSIASLGEFNGAKWQMVPQLFFSNGRAISFPNPSLHVFAAKEQDDWWVLGAGSITPNIADIYARKIWTQHLFAPTGGITLAGYGAGDTVDDHWVVCDATGANFYWFRMYADRPAFTTDTFANVGDDSTTPFPASFTTEEFTSEVGYQQSVIGYSIDFLSWATGSPSSNHFDVNLISTRPYQDSSNPSAGQGSITTLVGSYDDPAGSQGGSANSGGVRLRWENGISPSVAPESNGFLINIANIRGVAIERILIHTTSQLTRI